MSALRVFSLYTVRNPEEPENHPSAVPPPNTAGKNPIQVDRGLHQARAMNVHFLVNDGMPGVEFQSHLFPHWSAARVYFLNIN